MAVLVLVPAVPASALRVLTLTSKFAIKLEDDVGRIFDTTWNDRAGLVVPNTEDVALSNGAVRLNAVRLYADLASSRVSLDDDP